MTPLLLFSAFRYLGLSFLVPTVSDGLETTIFAELAAYGDFTVSLSLIALVAMFAVKARWSFGIILAWVYAVLGSFDFMVAGFLASQSDLPLKAGRCG